jgi:hypothetical protein
MPVWLDGWAGGWGIPHLRAAAKQTFRRSMMKRYEEVFQNHKGFISHKWIHYFSIYDLLFSKYRKNNRPLTMMEIGVDRGGSLEI